MDSSNPRFKFRRFKQRDDIDDIKRRCTSDSIGFESGGNWRTSNMDDYRDLPLSAREIIKPPPVSVCLGGGKLSPSGDEMRSNYMSSYRSYNRSDFAKIAPSPPDSQVLPRDYAFPRLSTAHTAMLETSTSPRGPENSAAAHQIAENQRRRNISLGSDENSYKTTMMDVYTASRMIQQPVNDGLKNKVSIEFDKIAGLGPNEKALSKRRFVQPYVQRLTSFDQHNKNFDTGYSKPDYITTSTQSYTGERGEFIPRAVAPPCAELSNHGPYAPKWSTTYASEFQKKTPIENTINVDDLRKTHWDQGHDKVEWPKNEPPPTARRTPKGEDLQKSNVVFRGDGKMSFETTQNSLIGNFDRNIDPRVTPSNEGRMAHIFMGSDKPSFSTSVQEMNRMAGKGKPAEPYDDYSKVRGPCYARGNEWDRFVGKELVDTKRYRYASPAARVDGSYYRQSHFDLEATSNNKPRYTTTYYKTICKPMLEI